MSVGITDKVATMLTLFVALLIVVGGVFFIYPNYMRSESLKSQNAELKRKIDRCNAEISKLVENQRRFRTDADFVEMIARQNHRVFPGELVFIFDKD